MFAEVLLQHNEIPLFLCPCFYVCVVIIKLFRIIAKIFKVIVKLLFLYHLPNFPKGKALQMACKIIHF